MTNEPVYEPPSAGNVPERVGQICDFANARSKPFVHPVVKAMVLHFAVGFVHPFVDGNGRTARALFYWHMLKSGYWLLEYLPISRVLVNAPARYARAFLYAETDDGDVTYFNHYHLSVILRAINDLHDYLGREQRKLKEAERFLEAFTGVLNHRQRSLIWHALKHPTDQYTARSHEGRYHVTYATARSDLMGLEKMRLLKKAKKEAGGKGWVYYPAENLMKLLKSPAVAQAEVKRPKEKPKKPVVATVRTEGPAGKTLFDEL
jgi:Fic family protein